MDRSLELAVVQLFVQTAVFDWLDPYKTPMQLETFGSGFFINEYGFLLTNFHVVSEAVAIHAQAPSFGKERFELTVIGIYPERDVALLCLTEESRERFISLAGKIPSLLLGRSDSVKRGDDISTYGYPLGQEALKITQGVVSGQQDLEGETFLQVTAALNPGNSGGPCVDEHGQVVGINTAIIPEAQSIGYVVPIDDVKPVIRAMHKVAIVHRPVLGCDYNYGSIAMCRYFGNPEPGGIFINKIYPGTSFDEAGILAGDMVYRINNYQLDMYGDTHVEWSDDKINFTALLHRFEIGEEITIEYYRSGKMIKTTIHFSMQKPLPIRKMFPEFEEVAYEIFGGLVIMPLSLNHLGVFEDNNSQQLDKYAYRENQYQGRLIISRVFQNSPAQEARVLLMGDVIDEINGRKVYTIDDLRKTVQIDKKYLSIKVSDGRYGVFFVEDIVKEELRLITQYRYRETSLYSYFQELKV